MTYRLEETPIFARRVRKFRRQHPDLKPTLDSVLAQLVQDPNEASLRLHALLGNLDGLHAVSVTHRYRILLELQESVGIIVLINNGSHDDVYG